uniref:Uncharacterized protein n=1 Tax=Rhodnius prolixus TaxID=13249 RepID=T1I4X0_RHOPR
MINWQIKSKKRKLKRQALKALRQGDVKNGLKHA